MSLSISSSCPGSYSSAIEVGGGSLKKPIENVSVEAEFLKEARKSPVERMREAILKKLGLTEEQFQALDPKTKAAVEQTIREEIAKRLQATGDKSLGILADLNA